MFTSLQNIIWEDKFRVVCPFNFLQIYINRWKLQTILFAPFLFILSLSTNIWHVDRNYISVIINYVNNITHCITLISYTSSKWTELNAYNYVLRSSRISHKPGALIVRYQSFEQLKDSQNNRKQKQFIIFLAVSFVFNCFENLSIAHNFGTIGSIQVGFSAKCTSPNEYINQIENWKCHILDFRLISKGRITSSNCIIFEHMDGSKNNTWHARSQTEVVCTLWKKKSMQIPLPRMEFFTLALVIILKILLWKRSPPHNWEVVGLNPSRVITTTHKSRVEKYLLKIFT